jgi:membrane-bound serine protease (ClpP class)
MDFLIDPNVAYILIVTGVVLTLLAIITPGTGMLEVSAGFALLLAAYGAFNLGISWWALIILALAVVPFVFSLRSKYQTALLGLTVAAITVGSIFLFQDQNGWPEVNPLLAIIVAGLSSLTIWLVTEKTLEAHRARPSHDLSMLIGLIGEARTVIHLEGSVQAHGELWTARSDQPIPAGSKVRVTGRDGFVLIVEKTE